MNDPHESLPDELIDDMLAPLRAVILPDEVRSANREAVQRALARRAQPPWWRRTVAVPVPVAIAATVALIVTAAVTFWPSFGRQTVEREALRPPRTDVVEIDASASDDLDRATGPGWSVTRSYILSIESLAKVRESFPPDATEKRNDT